MQTTKATIYGLRPLADCAFLESLSINLDAAILDQNIGLQPNTKFSNSPLSFLSVGHAPIGDPIPVASFLSNYFPNLAEIDAWIYDGYGDDNVMEREMWEQVWTFYGPFLTIRKQEREWAMVREHNLYKQ